MKISRDLCVAIFAVLSLASIASATKVSEPGKVPYYTTIAEGVAAAAEAKKPMAIDFITDWCIWCKVMDTSTYLDSNVISNFSSKMVLVKVDAEKDTVAALKYGVIGYPTIVVTNYKAEEFDRIIGYLPASDFLTTIGDYQVGKGTLQAMLVEAKTDKSPQLANAIADKYKYRTDEKNAEAWYQKVLATATPGDTLSAKVRIAIADMYRRTKEFDRSLQSFMAIEKDFTGTKYAAEAALYLGIVQAKKGDNPAAIAAYQRYLKLYPAGEDVDYAKEQIEKLTKKAGS